jgi:hypothetical protein
MSRLRLHLVSCRVFERELEVIAPSARTDLKIQYLEMGLHEKPGEHLRAALQQAVDGVPAAEADAIAIGYGLCNRGLVGLMARGLPVVIPRAHDCLGILLGSTKRYLAELDKEAGTYFQSAGWIEHLPADRTLRPLAAGSQGGLSASKAELVERYGEENAEFLMKAVSPGCTNDLPTLPRPSPTESSASAEPAKLPNNKAGRLRNFPVTSAGCAAFWTANGRNRSSLCSSRANASASATMVN